MGKYRIKNAFKDPEAFMDEMCINDYLYVILLIKAHQTGDWNIILSNEERYPEVCKYLKEYVLEIDTSKEDSEKMAVFIYSIQKLLILYAEINKNTDINNNDFTILKVMKLMFFLTTASIDIDKTEDKSNNLLNIFDKWEAMVLGHTNSDLKKYIVADPTFQNYLSINSKCTKVIKWFNKDLEDEANRIIELNKTKKE